MSRAVIKADEPGDEAPDDPGDDEADEGYFAGAHGFYINTKIKWAGMGGVSQRALFAQVGTIIDRPHGSYPGCRKCFSLEALTKKDCRGSAYLDG